MQEPDQTAGDSLNDIELLVAEYPYFVTGRWLEVQKASAKMQPNAVALFNRFRLYLPLELDAAPNMAQISYETSKVAEPTAPKNDAEQSQTIVATNEENAAKIPVLEVITAAPSAENVAEVPVLEAMATAPSAENVAEVPVLEVITAAPSATSADITPDEVHNLLAQFSYGNAEPATQVAENEAKIKLAAENEAKKVEIEKAKLAIERAANETTIKLAAENEAKIKLEAENEAKRLEIEKAKLEIERAENEAKIKLEAENEAKIKLETENEAKRLEIEKAKLAIEKAKNEAKIKLEAENEAKKLEAEQEIPDYDLSELPPAPTPAPPAQSTHTLLGWLDEIDPRTTAPELEKLYTEGSSYTITKSAISQTNIEAINDFLTFNKIQKVAQNIDLESIAQNSISENQLPASHTLAKIYETQQDYAQALNIYEQLVVKNPNKLAYFAQKIDKLKNILDNNTQNKQEN